ncbi:FAD-dependent oxidoreductase [Dongia sp.]|jgi:sarcosine oxidase|uniref:FAD-dependent oxidoreductase n=1 Tax=Dongia sp. TaxID=1977262 RepID=UPI0035B3DF2A
MSGAQTFDTIVIGGGVFGMSSAFELARRGQRVAVIDRFGSGHEVTSSTGASRSIRVAYDHPFYVNLALEAIAGWHDLEARSGHKILHLTGQIDLGPAAKLAALADHVRAAGVEIAALDADGVRALFPEMHLLPHEGALYHAHAGTVLAEVGLMVLAQAAAEAGATILAPERVTALAPDGAGVRVDTGKRELRADRIVMAAGPWSGALLSRAGLDLPLAPAVAQVTFLDAPDLTERPGLAEWQAVGKDGADGGLYGHPVPGIGYKIAFDAGQAGWDSEVTSWSPDFVEERRLLDWFHARFPDVPAKVARTQRHPWTMTPDADFIVDEAGGDWGRRLILACGCSGHAFKFGPALGRLVADVAEGGAAPELLRRDRPGLLVQATATAPITR